MDGELAEGQFLDLMCVADLGQFVDIDVTVTMTWMRDNMPLTNGDEFTITPPIMSGSNSQYTGVLRINSLRDERDNGATYNCSVNVVSNIPFVSQGNYNSSAVTLTVASKFNVSFLYFIFLIDFDRRHIQVNIIIPSVPVAGDEFRFTCQIITPPNFVENLTSVRWTYDLGAYRDVIAENNDASVAPIAKDRNIFTSVLMLDPVKTNDASLPYYCQVTINLFGFNENTMSSLTVQSQL